MVTTPHDDDDGIACLGRGSLGGDRNEPRDRARTVAAGPEPDATFARWWRPALRSHESKICIWRGGASVAPSLRSLPSRPHSRTKSARQRHGFASCPRTSFASTSASSCSSARHVRAEDPRLRGNGALKSWLRTMAVRAFIDLVRSNRVHRHEPELDEADLLGFSPAHDTAIRSELAAAVKSAFAAAVARLTPRQRVFLRHVYVDHHTLDQIAARYKIHRTTVARTLAAAREQLIAETRAGLVAAIGIDPPELSSVVRELDSHIDLSLSRILASTRSVLSETSCRSNRWSAVSPRIFASTTCSIAAASRIGPAVDGFGGSNSVARGSSGAACAGGTEPGAGRTPARYLQRTRSMDG